MRDFTAQTVVSNEPSGAISRLYLADEAELVESLANAADIGGSTRRMIRETAQKLVESVRRESAYEGGIDAFLAQYDLSSEEGILLMCIAEALLRIPDADTADRLIADKIGAARWEDHLGASDSLFVNASTWGLMLTGRMLKVPDEAKRNPAAVLRKIASRTGEPVVRTAMRQAMRIMGHQFVMGRDIGEALRRAEKGENRKYRYSFDMLGEAALTAQDAERYFEAYAGAIEKIGGSADDKDIFAAPSISVKLSALHPRYVYTQHGRVMKDLVPVLTELALMARRNGIALTVDAEEAERLELSLDVFEAVYLDRRLREYEGFGLAVQAYQRRATDVLSFVASLAARQGRRIPVRLVKGAYWDTEIKRAQEQGLQSYPVFTRKSHTDVSYLACARQMLEARQEIYPQFATHNAHTLASVMHFAGRDSAFEFQRLHGMGEELYAEIIDPEKFDKPCRVYAPVGSHEDLLPYLVRRLLENGANTSFVNRILDESVDVEDIVADPVEISKRHDFKPHPHIPQPPELFGPERKNSRGHNLADRSESGRLFKSMRAAGKASFAASPIVGGKAVKGAEEPSTNPADRGDTVGTCVPAGESAVDEALERAAAAQVGWDRAGAEQRAQILERAADLYERDTATFLALCVREAGKTIPDSIAEVREAVDFLRFYANEARRLYGKAQPLPGPTGESNELGLRGRGVFVCVSPWNFPLAIFTGQVAAALAAGNAVLAKPAEQTPLIAHHGIRLLHEAGVPGDVLHFLPGDGATVGGRAVADPRVAGVAFTGSTQTARIINRTLAEREGALPVLIAETGGQNAMFVDSSALPEQVVIDAVTSSFNAAGQRCSALRVLCVQEDVASRIIELLAGAMRELSIGDPGDLETDVGPVIDEEALERLEAHVERMEKTARILERVRLPRRAASGTFLSPVAIEIESLDQLEGEVFGPVLHVLRYRRRRLAETVEAVNATGYGLTMGLHSRIGTRARDFVKHSAAGNIYINRNMIGAIVGSQPFGGRGLSGTGPKAGGPHYLARFGTEYAVSNNIAAVGGNATLLSLSDS